MPAAVDGGSQSGVVNPPASVGDDSQPYSEQKDDDDSDSSDSNSDSDDQLDGHEQNTQTGDDVNYSAQSSPEDVRVAES